MDAVILDPGSSWATAREIIDTSLYLVLATADATGLPWSSPVYFAHDRYTDFLWVSSPDAQHSRNIEVRAQIGISIFDSRAPIGTGQGVYVGAAAELVSDQDLAQAVRTFSARSLRHGGVAWARDDVRPASGIRMYRATADHFSILAKDGKPDHRIPAFPD